MTKPMCLVDDFPDSVCAAATRALQGSTTPTGAAHEVCPKWIGTGSVRHVSTRFWIAPSSIQLGSLQSSSLPSLVLGKKRLGPKTTHNTRPLSDETLSRTA